MAWDVAKIAMAIEYEVVAYDGEDSVWDNIKDGHEYSLSVSIIPPNEFISSDHYVYKFFEDDNIILQGVSKEANAKSLVECEMFVRFLEAYIL